LLVGVAREAGARRSFDRWFGHAQTLIGVVPERAETGTAGARG
jgi:hypothetical protein